MDTSRSQVTWFLKDSQLMSLRFDRFICLRLFTYIDHDFLGTWETGCKFVTAFAVDLSERWALLDWGAEWTAWLVPSQVCGGAGWEEQKLLLCWGWCCQWNGDRPCQGNVCINTEVIFFVCLCWLAKDLRNLASVLTYFVGEMKTICAIHGHWWGRGGGGGGGGTLTLKRILPGLQKSLGFSFCVENRWKNMQFWRKRLQYFEVRWVVRATYKVFHQALVFDISYWSFDQMRRMFEEQTKNTQEKQKTNRGFLTRMVHLKHGI